MQSFDHNTHGWFKPENIDDLLGLFLCCGVKLNKNKEELEVIQLIFWSFVSFINSFLHMISCFFAITTHVNYLMLS